MNIPCAITTGLLLAFTPSLGQEVQSPTQANVEAKAALSDRAFLHLDSPALPTAATSAPDAEAALRGPSKRDLAHRQAADAVSREAQGASNASAQGNAASAAKEGNAAAAAAAGQSRANQVRENAPAAIKPGAHPPGHP